MSIRLEDGAWTVRCDGACGLSPDEENWGVDRWPDVGKAVRNARQYGWTLVAPDLVYCPDDIPADVPDPAWPSSPAELEAAGQLPLVPWIVVTVGV